MEFVLKDKPYELSLVSRDDPVRTTRADKHGKQHLSDSYRVLGSSGALAGGQPYDAPINLNKLFVNNKTQSMLHHWRSSIIGGPFAGGRREIHFQLGFRSLDLDRATCGIASELTMS